MLTDIKAQAIVEYLFLVTVVAFSLLAMFLLSQEVLTSLYNQIKSVIESNI